VLASLQEELKILKRQRARDLLKHPEQEQILDNVYDVAEEELLWQIQGLQNQIDLARDKRNTIIRVNRAAKTVLDIFDDIIGKDKLDRNDLHFLIRKIRVFEDHVDIELKPDIDTLLRCGTLPEDAVNFNDGMENIEPFTIIQSSFNHSDKVLHANVVRGGDPLEIYTEKDGGVVFREYSPMGELADFAGQICDSLHRTTGQPVAVCDRDAVIAVSGLGRRELVDKRISSEMEQLMESRGIFAERGDCTVPVAEGEERWCLAVAAPILSQGDVIACVTFL
jgi:stage V sporulation protein T